MAKKYKSTKLIKQSVAATQKVGSAFGKFANRLADARKKKIQKLTDTQKRLLQSKKNNKMIKVSKKAKKFALLDEQNQQGDGTLGMTMTHRGVNIKDLKQFDDVNLGESDLQNDQQFDQFQDKMNFAGFEATDNLLQERKQVDPSRQKTQTQIYKQIIEKSKAYKMIRQQQYQQNFNMANELDQGFDKLKSQLKFRNKDQQMLEKLENRDLEYDRLMNELKEDERVVSNKIVEKNQKYTENIRKKKNQQLNKLMKDNGEDADIRGWVDDVEGSEDGEDEEEGSDEEGSQEVSGEEEDENQSEEGSYDELDEVNLSSKEEGEGQEEEQGDEVQNQEEQQQNQEDNANINQADQGQEPLLSSDEEQGSDQDQDDQDEEDDQEDEQESSSMTPPQRHDKNKNKRQQHQQPNKRQQPVQPSKQGNVQLRQVPQKKRKLNFVE